MYFIGMDLGIIGHFKFPKWGNHYFGNYMKLFSII